MDERMMPLVVFACSTCGEQQAVRLTRHYRRDDKPDQMEPVPTCSCGDLMTPIQIDYAH